MLTPAAPSATLESKHQALRSALRARLPQGLIVAYSGGVDSAFLLWAAEQERRVSGGRLLAVTAVSASLARVEREDAARFAALVGAEHRWEETAELENPAYLRNDLDRCYHCKTELFRLSHDLAARLGYGAIAYGYNASDRGDFRPGHRAAKENDIIAPLDEAGLTKEEIAELTKRSVGAPRREPPLQRGLEGCIDKRGMRAANDQPRPRPSASAGAGDNRLREIERGEHPDKPPAP